MLLLAACGDSVSTPPDGSSSKDGGLGSCFDTDGGGHFFIAGNVLPEESAGGCVLDSDGALLISPGTFNVEAEVGGGYEVFPLYVNQLMHDARVRSAEVVIRDSRGSPIALSGLPNPFSVPTETLVLAGDEGVGAIEAIPDAYRQRLAASGRDEGTIVIAVSVQVETDVGSMCTTGEWTWAVELCAGDCLFECVDPDMPDDYGCTPGQDSVSPGCLP